MSGSYELHQPTSHPTHPPLIPEESPPFPRVTGGSPTANGDGPVGATSMTKTGWVRTSASMNPNLYATKKTLAQGMLDVALLSVNATQLKTIIQRGDEHDFYTVLVVLISLSIALQLPTNHGYPGDVRRTSFLDIQDVRGISMNVRRTFEGRPWEIQRFWWAWSSWCWASSTSTRTRTTGWPISSTTWPLRPSSPSRCLTS